MGSNLRLDSWYTRSYSFMLNLIQGQINRKEKLFTGGSLLLTVVFPVLPNFIFQRIGLGFFLQLFKSPLNFFQTVTFENVGIKYSLQT